MAEAMFRQRYGDRFNIVSAGVEPWAELHPMAVKLMGEDGIDMAGHYPQHVKEYLNDKIDIAVTIGDRAEAESGYFRTGTLRIHWPINDPADADGTSESEGVFRWTRQAVLDRFPDLLAVPTSLKNSFDKIWQPGISTCVFRPNGDWQKSVFIPTKHIPIIKQAGFETIELCCYFGERDFDWQDNAKINELIKIASDYDISINSIHTPDLHLCSQDRADGEKMDTLKRCAEVTMQLDAQLMVVHYSPDKTDDSQQDLPEILVALDTLVHDKPLLVGIETLLQREANSKFSSLFKQLNPSSFGFVIDTGHSNITGDLYDSVAVMGKALKSLHIHDNDAELDQHLPIGAGNIAWNRFVDSLIKAEYEGPLMLETDERLVHDNFTGYLKKLRNSLDFFYDRMVK